MTKPKAEKKIKNKYTMLARRWDERKCEFTVWAENISQAKSMVYEEAEDSLPGTEPEIIMELVSVELGVANE